MTIDVCGVSSVSSVSGVCVWVSGCLCVCGSVSGLSLCSGSVVSSFFFFFGSGSCADNSVPENLRFQLEAT